MTLSQALKKEAHRLGFDLVGITTPDPPPHLANYGQWIAERRHGEMGYLATDQARSRRADPRIILPDCQSILVLGARYPMCEGPSTKPGKFGLGEHQPSKLISRIVTPGDNGPGNRVEGLIAAYACGPDYHDLFPPRLQALIAFIESQIGQPVPHRPYTDTGPVLERELAQRAGLGWIGKNTCLIAPGLGSYLLLAEIFLGLALDPDPPYLPDRCGSCNRCLIACPTGCIRSDRTLDAPRCISYLTIELKSSIPADLRPGMGEWVFGCDVCQQVCPWNRFAPVPPPGLIADLQADLQLTPIEFNRRFKGTPVMRAKRRGYLRNAAVALGNSHEPVAIPALVRALSNDAEPLVRGHAAWALGQIGGEAAREALQTAIHSELDPSVRAEIAAAISQAFSM